MDCFCDSLNPGKRHLISGRTCYMPSPDISSSENIPICSQRAQIGFEGTNIKCTRVFNIAQTKTFWKRKEMKEEHNT